MMEDPRLTHVDATGTARMVDVSEKPDTLRIAEAAGSVRMLAETVRLIREASIAKGDVLTVARVAGVLAAKQTAHLIPLCHPLLPTDIQVDLTLESHGVEIRSRITVIGKTGAEMEALVAVSAAALTVYDMCKAVDRGMVLGEIRVLRKQGGKSDWTAAGAREGAG